MQNQSLESLLDRLDKQKSKTIPANLSTIPFWCNDFLNHKDGDTCCYNHFIGLPKRWGYSHPLYEYEIELNQHWSKYKKQHIEKAAGLGITEFFLRKLEHEALTNPLFANSQVEIVSGPNKHLAKELIERMAGSKQDNNDFHNLKNLGIARDVDDYSFRIGSTQFEAVPSDNIEALRGKPRPSVIFIDEAAFFLMKKDSEIKIRQAAEHYDLKSDPWIIWVSTPGFIPQGVFYDIKTEENSQYKKIQLDYKVGLEVHPQSLTSIYPREKLEEAKKSRSFAREYQLVWGGGEGNIFHWELVDAITQEYDLTLQQGRKGLYLDPSYGSSKFAILGMERIGGIVFIKESMEFERASPSAMLDMVLSLASKYNNNVIVDSAHPGLISDLQTRKVNARGIVFGKELSGMTILAAQAVKDKKIMIHPIYHDLISQLKAIEFDKKGNPDKTKLNFDLGDAFLMGVSDLIDGDVGIYKFKS